MDKVFLFDEPIRFECRPIEMRGGLVDVPAVGVKVPDLGWFTPDMIVDYISYLKAGMEWDGTVNVDVWVTPKGKEYHTKDRKIQRYIKKVKDGMKFSATLYETKDDIGSEGFVEEFLVDTEIRCWIEDNGRVLDVVTHNINAE